MNHFKKFQGLINLVTRLFSGDKPASMNTLVCSVHGTGSQGLIYLMDVCNGYGNKEKPMNMKKLVFARNGHPKHTGLDLAQYGPNNFKIEEIVDKFAEVK